MEPVRERPILDVSGLPEVMFGRSNTTWLGNVLYMTIEGTMFALVIASYFYLRTRASTWPPINLPPSLAWGLLSGIIFLVIGYYLVLAGWNVDPQQVEGQAGALHIIAQQPLGPMMLGFISIGLVALGAFSFAELRYGRIPREKLARIVDYAHVRQTRRIEDL